MTLMQFFRKMRGQAEESPYPTVNIEDLSPEGRAFIEARRHSLDGWTAEELDEHARRTLAGHEDELREAIREAEERRKSRKLSG